MSKLVNVLYEVDLERECSIRGVCGKDMLPFSLMHVTIFGLEILSKGQSKNS